ncbi:MAG: translation initiation factor IF-3 [Deltaproteobacteria bacterium]|nr:translation initiation factor IF-3 [Deltaproteobacteria bacterium]
MGKKVNVNRGIRAEKVRLIDQDSQQAGIMETSQAPVCRIMDYGKYKYQQSKKLQESKKKATIILVKEVKIRPKTEEHDYQFKLRNIRKFLEQKNKTKISLMFRGREIAHANLARGLLERIAGDVADIGVVEQMPKLEGRNMTMMLAPK